MALRLVHVHRSDRTDGQDGVEFGELEGPDSMVDAMFDGIGEIGCPTSKFSLLAKTSGKKT